MSHIDADSRHWQRSERLPGGAACVPSIGVRRVVEAARVRERARPGVMARLWERLCGVMRQVAVNEHVEGC